MIQDLIQKSFDYKKMIRKGKQEYLQPSTDAKTIEGRGVPTLKNGVYREYSPMLSERYEMFGRWKNATHGHWLSITDMESLWEDDPAEDFLKSIKMMRQAGEDGWPNEASALFRPERLSLFACSDLTNETIYLLWLDFEDEPEFWVYDSNGETRYKNLEEYLKAYLNGDLSALDRSWRASS